MDIHINYHADSAIIDNKKWYIKGKLHDKNSLLKVEKYFTNGKISEIQYYKEGELYKDFNEPAQIYYSEDGTLHAELYYKEGKLDNDNNPAHVVYNTNGKITLKRWYKEGRPYRIDDLPNDETYYGSGKIERQMWRIDNHNYAKCYRGNDLPSWIEFYENGNKKEEFWSNKEGMQHRENKYSLILYDQDGNITKQTWFKDGVEVKEEVKSAETIINNYKQKEQQYFDNKCPHCKCDIKLTYTIVKED